MQAESTPRMRVLMITSVWPTPAHPEHAPFVVRQVEFLRRLGVTVDVFHLEGQRSPVNYARSWRRVRALLRPRSYDVVHAQWGQAAVAALPRAAPLVITFRGSDLEGIVGSDGRYLPSGRVLRALSKTVARFADEIIVVSSRLARHLPHRECHVIPSGLDLELFQPIPQGDARQQLGLRADRRYVLFAASPDKSVKRHGLAVKAVAALTPRCDVELLVAANVAPTLMPVYMSACDALILTSAHEGSPNVVKEALACDLPVVSVDVGDVRARLERVDGCVVCPDDRPATLAAALAAVLERNQRVAGRAAVRDLDETVLTTQVLAVYRRAVERYNSKS